MKKEDYEALQDIAFSRHWQARINLDGHPLARLALRAPEMVGDLLGVLHSAFQSGVKFGEASEDEILGALKKA